ncbi:hypothetical protein ACJW8F_13235 [Plesiomonas shigelloides]|uniref:hypothetical protein n=1 Tax=Plesiomonas shigelloides TaxID=703 RepID=UPI00387F0C36
MIHRKTKTLSGLDSVERLLDGLTDPKFRARALRSAARKTLTPVKSALQSKLPAGGKEESSYKHYGVDGYKPGDLRDGVRLQIKVNTNKKSIASNGRAKKDAQSELVAKVTFHKSVYKLASILENGRQRRIASTKDGNVFHYFGHKTDLVQRDIGTTAPRNFVSETFAESEAQMTSGFASELKQSIAQEAKRLAKLR